MVDNSILGYNSTATSTSSKQIVSEEKRNARKYFFLLANLGMFAMLKNAASGTMYNSGFVLNLTDK
jgi:hypothetical protein